MKKKFLVLTLCFTLVFTSINYKKSYADGGVLSAPILATVVSLAVGSGIAIKNSDDIYDLGRIFMDYVNSHNSMTMTSLKSAFALGYSVLSNGIISVKESPFLDFVKEFFDNTFTDKVSSSGSIIVNRFGIPSWTDPYVHEFKHGHDNYFKVGDLSFSYIYKSGEKYNLKVTYKDNVYNHPYTTSVSDTTTHLYISNMNGNKKLAINTGIPSSGDVTYSSIAYSNLTSLSPTISFPYTGGYTWDNVESKKDKESIALPIPGDIGSLVGQPSDKFWDNTDNLVGTGGITLPGVDVPSIDVTDDVFVGGSDIPGDIPGDVPSEGIWSNITDYIISLVVPSDTFWTDTWNTLHNNFTNNFPMVDMGNFNQLVTGEKKFPNIDINIMGVNGRVVNGDVINSIVDWLRPIIAGFMMLCLMLFNYRKIYKTIRGIEPFQGVAQGTSDFRTGISEYNYLGSGLSKSDYEANEKELAKALHDHYEDTGKTYKVRI